MEFLKKFCLATFLILGCASLSHAQAIVGSTDEPIFEIGIIGGIDLGNVNRDNVADDLLDGTPAAATDDGDFDIKPDDEELSVGFIGFLRFAIIISSVFSIDFNIGYAQRGADLEELNDPADAARDGKTVDLCVDTISFPLMLKYLFSGGDFIPFIGLLLDFYAVLDAELDYAGDKATADLEKAALTGGAKDIINNFGFGIGPVLGFMYFVSEWVAITFHAWFSYSLTDLIDHKMPDDRSVDAHLYDIAFLLGFSYFWG